MRSFWAKMGPKSDDKSPYKRKVTETQAQRRQSYEDGGRDWTNGVTAKEHQRLPGNTEAGREAWNGFSLRALSDGTNPVSNLISDFWPPNNKNMLFCCFKPPSL